MPHEAGYYGGPFDEKWPVELDTATVESQQNQWGWIGQIFQGATNIIAAIRAPKQNIAPPASIQYPYAASAPPSTNAGDAPGSKVQGYLILAAVGLGITALVVGLARASKG